MGHKYSLPEVDVSSHHQCHHTTSQDEVQVRKFLLEFLPIAHRIAGEILQRAEYWPRIVSRIQKCERGPVLGLVTTLLSSILYRSRFQKRAEDNFVVQAQKVRYEMRSYDQGGNDQQFLLDTYACSYSWFSVVILSESEAHGIRDPVQHGDITQISDLDTKAWLLQYKDVQIQTQEYIKWSGKGGNVDRLIWQRMELEMGSSL
ncbi:hypothetical protein AX16_007912 [Volvariella volvacea WC 439]|nr:hypothetical protein AX16_007912 [Volvariella volvacea WC 439]